jgi:serine/threonine-protein kinase
VAGTDSVSLPDRYRIVRHVANGGMAAVWAAEDELLHRLVAVKVLSPALAQDAAARRRFTREARAAARVSGHPNVVAIYDIGEHDGQAFIVMEHFAGGTVADRVRAPEPVPVPTALAWLEQAAGALDAAHAADVVHRDVKPGNLLLDEQGRLAVGDFGIASLAGETALTQVGQVVGTAAYLSPEQARGETATAASDRYALAVVAYELLCGRRPFGGDTPLAQLSARLHTDPPTPTGPCEAAAAALRHGLEREPADRPPTAMAFVEELREGLGDSARPATASTRRIPAAAAAAATAATPAPRPRTPRAEPVPPPPPASPRVAGRPAPPERRSNRLFAVAVAAAVLLGAIVAIAALSGGGEDGGQRASRTTSRDTDRAQRTTARSTPATAAPQATTEPQATTDAPTTTAEEPATTQAAPAPASGGDGGVPDGASPAELNDQGFARMQAGDYAGALPLLQAAVDGFREADETSERAYSYALFNLGRSLRIAGRGDEAVPYLQERLDAFDDRDAIVRRELARARKGDTSAAQS